MKEKRLVEVRALDNDNNEMILEGYAVVFDSITDLGYCNEVVERGAFDNADMSDIVMKYNHIDSILPLARTRGGSLTFEIDEHGLKVRAKLCDTTQNRDIYTLVKNGVLSKMSFAFTVSNEEWDYDRNLRKLRAFDKIYDVSVVDVPAYETTEIYARSKEEYEEEKRKYENLKLAKAKAIALLSL